MGEYWLRLRYENIASTSSGRVLAEIEIEI